VRGSAPLNTAPGITVGRQGALGVLAFAGLGALGGLGVAGCGAFGAAEDGPAAAADAAAAVDAAASDGAVRTAPDAGAGCTPVLDEAFTVFPQTFEPDTNENSSGALLDLSDVHVKSPPTALRVDVQGEATISHLIMPVAADATSSLVVDYDVWLTTTTTYVELGCTVEVRNGSVGQTRLLFAKKTGNGLSAVWDSTVGSQSGNAPLSAAIEDGWQHVRVVVAPGAPGRMDATFTVSPAGTAAASFNLPVPTGADRIRIRCGIDHSEGQTTPLSTWIDDLVVQTCPRR
jgi:hypothetical protein